MSTEVDNANQTPLSMDQTINNVVNVQATNGHSDLENGKNSNHDTKASGDSQAPSSFKMPRAPPHVYSCFVVNRTGNPIECDVHYDGRPGEDKFNEDVHVTIPVNGEHFFPRKLFQPDLPDSYCRWVKIITHIRAKKHDGKIVEADYPFENVHGPVRNWEFHVRDQGDILSKQPTRPANILKYENLDQYER